MAFSGSGMLAAELKSLLVERWRMNSVSLSALSLQVRLICELEAALALRLLGADTGGGGGVAPPPMSLWAFTRAAVRADAYTATSSIVPLKNSLVPLHEPMFTPADVVPIAPVRGSAATSVPLM